MALAAFLAILLAVPLLTVLLYHSVVRTETGAGWVLSMIGDRVEGFDHSGFEGNLANGLALNRPRFSGEGFDAEAQRLELAVTPVFFPLGLRVARIEADGLHLVLQESAPDEASDEWPESLALPIPVELERVRVDGLEVTGSDGTTIFQADAFEGVASLHEEAVLHRAALVLPAGRVEGGGRARLGLPYDVDFGVEGHAEFAIEDVAEPLSAEGSLRLAGELGAYRLHVDGGATLDRLALEALGELDLEAKRFEGRVGWRDFSWPLSGETAQIESRSGSAQVAGWSDDWRMEGAAELAAPEFAGGTLSFLAEGDSERARIVVPEALVLGGRISGEGFYERAGSGGFGARVMLEDIDASALYPDRPAVLSGGLAVSGGVDPLSLGLDATELVAKVDGRTVSANGQAHYRPGVLAFQNLALRSADSTVTLNGSLDRPEGIVFEADVADLGEFLPGFSGRLAGAGRFSNATDDPWLELDVQGRELSWDEYRVAGIRLVSTPAPETGCLADLRVEIEHADAGEFHVDSGIVTAGIGRERADVGFDLRTEEHRLVAQLPGRITNPGEPWRDWTWLGRLEDLQLASDGASLLSLTQEGALEARFGKLSMQPVCLEVAGRAEACLEGRWSTDSGWAADGALREVPLEALGLITGDFEFTQALDGKFEVRMPPASGLEADASFTLLPGDVRMQGQAEPVVSTGAGKIGLRVRNGAVTAGTFDLPVTGQGHIDLDFEVGELEGGADAPLRGRLNADFEDLDALAVFIPIADDIRGRLQVNLDMLGTLGRPFLQGRLAVSEGYLRHAASGLTFSGIRLSGQADGSGRTSLEGSFSTLNGDGYLEGLVDLDDFYSPSVQLDIGGENLLLFDGPELRLVTDPDIRLAWYEGVLHVDGRIVVPSARLSPSVLPAPPVMESPDVEIVAGELPRSQRESSARKRIDVFGQLDVVLGDDVEVDLSIAEADIAGQTRFDWSGPAVPVANGAFNLSGLVLAYGQRLEITEGRIGFPGVPADNPHLNIRAEREIYGNSEVRRAGLWVTGTLKRLQLEPYTTPMTSRERAQTLLVTGSDFNMERGSGAVSVGTYIAPRVFVSYGVGVFDSSSVISVRYDIGRGWGVMGTSGERQTGIDISYTIER